MSAAGLAGVIAGTTELSFIDGQEGLLVYRGYDIRDLARDSTYEETVFLLWNGRLPSPAELAAFSGELAAARHLSKEQLDVLATFPKEALPMEVLRAMVARQALTDPDREDVSPEATRRLGVRLVGGFPLFVGAFHRLRQGKEYRAPPKGLSHAASFLHALHGEAPSEEQARVMDVALILHADHGFNASTFAARVTASTLADLNSAVVTALSTLSGPLHGAANRDAMNLRLKIGDAAKAEAYVLEALARKEKIPGFGHRVYKTMDPRAAILKGYAETLGKAAGQENWHEMSTIMEDAMMREKGLSPNVDFYSATTYYAMGIPVDLFTPIFAVSRVAGWVAHAMEQYGDNKIIRPKSEYTGAKGLVYTPLNQRAA
ncbi:MAG: citrate/2-methylcitrate synthase [Thermoplasmata archaeon]